MVRRIIIEVKDREINERKNRGIIVMKKFFKSFLFLGIIILLVGIIVDLVIGNLFDHNLYKVCCDIVATALNTIGVGLILGYVMDMTKNSEDYKIYIEDRLSEVIVKKDFIDTLSVEQKQRIVERCLLEQNTHQQMVSYTHYKSTSLTQISKGNLRSNIDYVTKVYKDRNKNKVMIETTISFRMYKIGNKYQPITHYFDKPANKILSMKIIPPEGKAHEVPAKDLKVAPQSLHGNEIAYINSVNIPSRFKECDYLTLKIKAQEEAYDHWAHVVWMSLYPTENISYKINCKDGLIIKEHFIFDNQQGLYYTEIEKDANNNIINYSITCDQWTDPYTGFSLIISEP